MHVIRSLSLYWSWNAGHVAILTRCAQPRTGQLMLSKIGYCLFSYGKILSIGCRNGVCSLVLVSCFVSICFGCYRELVPVNKLFCVCFVLLILGSLFPCTFLFIHVCIFWIAGFPARFHFFDLYKYLHLIKKNWWIILHWLC